MPRSAASEGGNRLSSLGEYNHSQTDAPSSAGRVGDQAPLSAESQSLVSRNVKRSNGFNTVPQPAATTTITTQEQDAGTLDDQVIEVVPPIYDPSWAERRRP